MNVGKVVAQTPIPVKDPGLHEPIVPSATASTDLARLVEAFLTDSLARGLARGTVTYRRVYLAQLVAWLNERGIMGAQRVTPVILENYLAWLKSRVTDYKRHAPSPLSVKTLQAEASVLRSFFAWLTRRRVVLFDPAESLVLGDRTQPLPKSILTEREVQALLATPGLGALGLRDRALLETLYSTGLRRAELVALDLYDLDVAGELVRVRRGKGGRDRYVPIGAHALEALRRYLHEVRPGLVATPKEPALFVAAITRRRLSVKTLNLIVRKHADAAGIQKRVTPHVLRHTCATHLLQGGADLRHVQAILGHASIATTQIYTRVAVEDLAAVHRRHHPRRRLKIP
ncbi:MAG: tyrosine-type recombinase/integrase [bacterium]